MDLELCQELQVVVARNRSSLVVVHVSTLRKSMQKDSAHGILSPHSSMEARFGNPGCPFVRVAWAGHWRSVQGGSCDGRMGGFRPEAPFLRG